MKKAPDPGRPLRVTAREKARADDGLTIVVRPQPDRTRLVVLVDVGTGEAVPGYAMFAEDRAEISSVVAYILRWRSKMGAAGMADASRHRQWQKYKKKDADRESKQ